MRYLLADTPFPHPSEASPEGLVAFGGDLSPQRILTAYKLGIFPWFNPDEPILWWSPDPRMVLFPHRFKVSKSLNKTIRMETFKVTFNQHFSAVIQSCAKVKRVGQRGTWITEEMIKTYEELHLRGNAISVEVWKENKLVGGLYGIDLPEKKVFCGESMFSLVSDASKVGFYYWVQYLRQKNYRLIDCQVYTEHLESLGAQEIDRALFLSYLD
jgi:leucyl/phenylalanyl-tRNA---protein transferase